MSNFDSKAYTSFTHDVAMSMASLASLVRRDGSEEEYLACMDFGAGVMAAMSIVRDTLESGSVPSGASTLLQLAGVFDESQAKREFLKNLYGRGSDER